MFWTCAAREGSSNALGAVAGAGVSEILGFCVDTRFFDVDCSGKTGGVDGSIDGVGKDDEAVAGNNTC